MNLTRVEFLWNWQSNIIYWTHKKINNNKLLAWWILEFLFFFIYQERLYMPWDNTPRLHGFLTVHVACRKFVHIRNTPTISDYMNTTFRRTLQQIHTWNPAFHPRKSYFLCSKQVWLSGEGTCLPAALPGFESSFFLTDPGLSLRFQVAG